MTNHSSVTSGPFLPFREPYALADYVGSPSDPSNLTHPPIRALIYNIFTLMFIGLYDKIARVPGIKLKFS